MSSVELVRAALDAVDRNNDELVAVVHLDAEGALDAARRLDAERAAGRVVGPLHGVPITVKDVIDVARHADPVRARRSTRTGPSVDAASVARLRAAGAVVLGKASTHEFALGVTSPAEPQPTRHHAHPRWLLERRRGVASAPASASVRWAPTPARRSGSRPRCRASSGSSPPTGGSRPRASSRCRGRWTTSAPMAASVTDAALLLEVLLGRRPAAGRHRAPRSTGLTLGARPTPRSPTPSDELSAVVGSAIARAGVDAARRASMPSTPTTTTSRLANAAGLVVSRVEAAAAHRSLGTRPRALLGRGRRPAARRPLASRASTTWTRSGCGRALAERLLARVRRPSTCWSCRPSPVVAPPVDDFARYLMLLSRNAIPFSFVGFPAISVPCGAVDGLPVGLQIVAPPDREDLLVAVGRVVEAHHPPLGSTLTRRRRGGPGAPLAFDRR